MNERDAGARGNLRIAAIAAFAIAGLPLYLIGPRLIGAALGVQDPSGMDLDAQIAEILAHPNVYASLGLLSLVVGPSLIVLALALHEQLRDSAGLALRIGTTAGVLSGLLFLLAGFGPMTTAHWLAQYEAQDHAASVAMFVTNQSVTDRQISGSIFLFGAFTLLASLAGARAGLFSRAISYLGALTAIVAVAIILFPDLWLAGPLSMVVWSAWLGVALLRGGHKAESPRQETALGRA